MPPVQTTSPPPRSSVAALVSNIPSASARRRVATLVAKLCLPPIDGGGSSATLVPSPVSAALGDVRQDVSSAHSGSAALRRALEAVLVAAMGHAEDDVRDEAVVLLNVLYDGHMLQATDALPVTITEVDPEVSTPVTLPISKDMLSAPQALSVKTYISTPPSMSSPSSPCAPLPLADLGVAAKERTLATAMDPSRRGAIVVTFPPFVAPGYVDWVLVSSDSRDSRTLQTRRVAGRFVVQRQGARAASVVEVPIDEVGATWDEQTGRLRNRGSFDAVCAALPRIKASGATAVYLMGALERPCNPTTTEADADSSTPFVVARRDAPAAVLGGDEPFARLVKSVRSEGMTPVVDAIDRVSKTRAHRHYRGLHVSIRLRNADRTGCGEPASSGGDVLVPHPGTDARENQWEETVLLNYRDVNAWSASIHDVKVLAARYGVRGVRLDNAQSAPVIMEVDDAELYRRDTDGELHYSEEDRILGRVVYPNSEQGYWSTDAATYRGYPNPFLVKFCREMWAEYPDFLVLAESHFHREAQLSASGCIPHSIRVPQILASINGKSLRRDGSVVRLPDWRRSTAKTLSRLLKTDRVTMPKNYILAGCSCTHLSPYPGVLYGRRSWLAVDLLYFLPHVPMLLFGEDAGRAYRHNMAPATVQHVSEMSHRDVNFDEVLPSSPKRKTRGAAGSPVSGSVPGPFSSNGSSPQALVGVTPSAVMPPPLPAGSIGLPVTGGEHSGSGLGSGGVFGDGVHVPVHAGLNGSPATGGSISDSADGNVLEDNGNSNPVHGLAMGIGNLANMLNGGSPGAGNGVSVAVSGATPPLNGTVGASAVTTANGTTSTGAMMSQGHVGLAPLSGVGSSAVARGGLGSRAAGSTKPLASLPRRGSMSSLGLKISSSPKQQQARTGGMVRSMSRDDMRGTSIRNMSSEELRKMDALESAARAEIGPETGFDLSQINAHYSHRSLLRQEHKVIRDGKFCVIAADPASKDSVVSFARFNDNELVIVAANLRDARDGIEFAGGVSVDLDLRALWEDEIGLSPSFAAKAGHLYKFVNLFTGAEHMSGELVSLEEAVFRKLPVDIPPLGIVVLRLEHVAEPAAHQAMYDQHFRQCVTRLQESDASNSLKDARENFAIACIARGASASLHQFAAAVEKVRSGLVAEGCDGDTAHTILQLCLQRASALLPSVVYEHATPPKDFEPPTGERVSAYLALLSTVSSTPGMLEAARVLVKGSSKIGPLVFLTAELGRFSTAGGLGVMVDELTKGLATLGLEVYVVSPYYAVNRKDKSDYLGPGFSWTRNVSINIGTGLVDVGVFEGVEDGVNLIFLERKDFFSKVYANPGTSLRHLQCIVLMSLGSLEVFCQKAIKPAMIVTNDWLPSMAAGYARNGHFGEYYGSTTFFHLIHNLGDSTYEGRCYAEVEGDDMGGIHRLPRHCIVDPLWTRVVINPSRVALLCSDNWGTVSPTYMKELLSGHDLSPLLQMARRPFAYPNGKTYFHLVSFCVGPYVAPFYNRKLTFPSGIWSPVVSVLLFSSCYCACSFYQVFPWWPANECYA